jgi:hypothetical protein
MHHRKIRQADSSLHDEEPHTEEKRAVGDWVTAVINGQTVSWQNAFGGGAAPAAATPAPSASGAKVAHGANSWAPSSKAPASQAYSQPSAVPSSSPGSKSWSRQAYYNAAQGVADGLVFLNNNGGQGSGIFDYTWGNSLAYAAADANTGSASPVPLADTLIDDNKEIIIMTDKPCNGDCGAVREGTVAYHGFDGASKLFLVEFSMPLSGKTGFNADMPAAWLLNAEIPRTAQYGSCSCWKSGCGELDVFEVLNSGNQKCISAWHGLRSQGDSDYFPRPVDGTMKAAVILDGDSSTAHIVVLPDNTSFDTSLSDDAVSGFLNSIQDPKLNVKVALPS